MRFRATMPRPALGQTQIALTEPVPLASMDFGPPKLNKVILVTIEFGREEPGIVLGGVNNAFDPHTVRMGMIENQVLFKMPDSPHSQQWELPGFAGHAEV